MTLRTLARGSQRHVAAPMTRGAAIVWSAHLVIYEQYIVRRIND